IKKKINDKKEQIESYLGRAFPFPIKVSVSENKATVTMPQELPKGIADELSKKLKELTDTMVEFRKEKKVEASHKKSPAQDKK
ncbi:hypothetical protein HY497_01345, partial [Candidatus Woesearchaeota archaeon]|nr:hypothetical protein [Candidatus Woesearchaeota archaeon]